MPRIDKEQFPKTLIKIPDSEFPDNITIVFKGNDFTKPDVSKNTELVAKTADEAFGSPVQRGATGASEMFQQFEFIYKDSFTQTRKIKGVSYKIARIDTPFTNLSQVRAWAHRENWENNTPINIEMTVSPESVSNINELGFVWNRRITLRKYPELSIDYSVDYILNGTLLAVGGQLASMITPFMNAITMALAGEMLPSLPTAKQLASKYLGPAAPFVQQGLAIINTQYSKVKPYVDGFNLVTNTLKNCTDVEVPSVDFSLSKVKIPDFGVRQKIIDFLNGIIGQINGISQDQIDVPNLPNMQLETGLSSECEQSLYRLFEFVYELVPKEGIAGLIYEYGEG
jgi:hypothetical protein